MFLVSFSETCAYCVQYCNFSGRGFNGFFCKDINECIEIFKNHFYRLAEKKVSSNVYLSAKVDFSKYILIKDGDKFSLVLSPVKVKDDDFVCHFDCKRSWNYVCAILGFTPEFILCHLDDLPKKKQENK